MKTHIIQALAWLSINVMIAAIALFSLVSGAWRDDTVMGALLCFAVISVLSGMLAVRAIRAAFACRTAVIAN